MVSLAKAELNSIEVLNSKTLIDSNIKEYDYMKKEIKNWKV